jgi:NAD(P)-dependent dehydrogenase (short-subunit alcohol dehydrogenase family)
MAMVRVIEIFVPLLKSQGEGGHVVITSSSAGLLTLPPSMTSSTNIGVYTTLKFGVIGYGEMLRHELAEERIGVSVVCPGSLNTNLGRTSARYRPERFGGPYPYDHSPAYETGPECNRARSALIASSVRRPRVLTASAAQNHAPVPAFPVSARRQHGQAEIGLEPVRDARVEHTFLRVHDVTTAAGQHLQVRWRGRNGDGATLFVDEANARDDRRRGDRLAIK